MSQLHEKYNLTYVATAADNNVVKNKPGFLHAIILGEWVSGGTVIVSDHATDGNGNTKIYLKGGATDASGFPKTIIVDAHFDVGITADVGASQTKISFIWI